MSTCKTKKCGCTDVGLTTSIACGHPDCPNGTQCAESFSSDCIVYTGPNIIYNIAGGLAPIITTGMSMSEIAQIFVIWAQTDATKRGDVYLHFNGIVTSTTIPLAWNPIPGATAYEIHISTAATGPYTLIATTTNLYYTLTALPVNTIQYIYVQGVTVTTVSLIIQVSTTLT